MDVNSIVMIASDMMLWTLAGILVSVMVGIVVWFLSHKIVVRVRDIKDGNKFIRMDRGRIARDKGGTGWFKLLKTREKLPLPPSKAFNIGKRGKQFIDFYLTEDGVYLPIIDTFDFNEYKAMNEGILAKHLDEINEEKKYIPALKGIYEPFTTNQRSLFITEMMESDKYLKKDFWGHIKDIMPYVALIGMFALLIIFWGEITAPFLEAMGKAGQLLDKANEVMLTAQQQGQVLPTETAPN